MYPSSLNVWMIFSPSYITGASLALAKTTHAAKSANKARWYMTYRRHTVSPTSSLHLVGHMILVTSSSTWTDNTPCVSNGKRDAETTKCFGDRNTRQT